MCGIGNEFGEAVSVARIGIVTSYQQGVVYLLANLVMPIIKTVFYSP